MEKMKLRYSGMLLDVVSGNTYLKRNIYSDYSFRGTADLEQWMSMDLLRGEVEAKVIKRTNTTDRADKWVRRAPQHAHCGLFSYGPKPELRLKRFGSSPGHERFKKHNASLI